ncbi:MAG: hypothetical protein HFI33_09265 [Lachnospiraceae bacterium]|nr:hypothetical protein [Lachnospiraceae bacterium]
MELYGKYYYHDIGAATALSKISQRLSNLDICVEYIDEHFLDEDISNEERAEKIISTYVDIMVN